MGNPPFQPGYQQFLSATPVELIVISSIIADVIASIATSLATSNSILLALVGAAGFVAAAVIHQRAAAKTIEQARIGLEPRFPTPSG